MIKQFFILLYVTLCLALPNAVMAQKAPVMRAQSWIQVDRLTDTVLASSNADKRVNPGNSVLLMVLYTAEKAIEDNIVNRNTKITVNNDALSVPPLNAARFYVEPNKPVTVAELQKAVAILAANDAAVALAEGIGRTLENFVEMMNENAASLGMKNTHYTSVIGSSNKGQYSSARDTLILADALLNDCPELLNVWTQPDISNGLFKHANSNPFLWRTDAIRGLHTSEFQMKNWTSVVYFSRDYLEGDTRFSRELLTVTMGFDKAEHNTTDTMKLVNWGADNYKTLMLYQAYDTIDRIPVELTNGARVRVGVKESVYVTLPRDAILQKGAKGFSVKVSRLDPLVAPIKKDEKIGDMTVYFNEKPVAEAQLVSLHDVQQSNFWRRQWQRIKAIFGMH